MWHKKQDKPSKMFGGLFLLQQKKWTEVHLFWSIVLIRDKAESSFGFFKSLGWWSIPTFS